MIAKLLHRPLDPTSPSAADFLKGGYHQPGYGVPAGASIDGSFALGAEGTQGYYVDGGKAVFVSGVDTYQKFFQRHHAKGKPIRLVIKTGIGGQHTPFQGIADAFNQAAPKAGLILGEYELGKDFETSITQLLKALGAGWDQLAVIPSSKSGSTDETMLIFVQIFAAMLQHACPSGVDGKAFAGAVMQALHDVNFIDGKERPGVDLFKVDAARLGASNLIDLIAQRTKQSRDTVKTIFAQVLGHMVFETTPRASQSRLAAFLQNSGLAAELGDEAPGVVDMFDNVGGRWTGDLHIMAILGFHHLDAGAYWEARRKGIDQVRQGIHPANTLAKRILQDHITDIALVVPEILFWFGKATEQNFNESIWQEGFANLITIKEKQWPRQEKNYKGKKGRLILQMSELIGALPKTNLQDLAHAYADLFTLFYGITNSVGCALIERALETAGQSPAQVNLNDLQQAGTKIVQENLFLRQPYVELGKGLLESEFKQLQDAEQKKAGAIADRARCVLEKAKAGELRTNLENYTGPKAVHSGDDLTAVLRFIQSASKAEDRKVVPFLYLDGEKFIQLRDVLIDQGVEWVMQGTGDQHISYQQVLAQPKRFLPLLISFISEKPLPGLPAIGFAKGYLDRVSPDAVRDTFAEKSYLALTDLKDGRGAAGGRGFFLRILDTPPTREWVQGSFKKAFA